MTVGIEEADVRACQTRNTPSPGLRFWLGASRLARARTLRCCLARVNTTRYDELLGLVEGTGHGVARVPATLIFPMGSPSGT